MNFLSFFIKNKLKFTSNISGEIIVEEYFGKRTLFMNDVPQSGGEFESMWKKVIGKIKSKKVNSCLVLGVGGATALKYLLLKHKNIPITGIELDPVIIDIQKKYFSLQRETRVNLICDDAFRWVDKNLDKSKFDLIIVDLYHNRLNPDKARSRNFIAQIKKMTEDNGQVIFNAHFQPEKPGELDEFLKTCKKEFSKQEIIFTFKYNRIILLTA